MSVEQIVPLITAALSADKGEQTAAQEQLEAAKPLPDYATSLLTILFRQVNKCESCGREWSCKNIL